MRTIEYYGPYHDKCLDITESLREQIYEDVWSEPMYKVASKYHISSAPLKRRCKECWDIPVPDSDYWSRVRAGRKEKRPALPMPPCKTARDYVSEYAVSYIDLEKVPEDDLYTEEPMFVFSDKTKKLVAEAANRIHAVEEIRNPAHYEETILKNIKRYSHEYEILCFLHTLIETADEFEGGGHFEWYQNKSFLYAGDVKLCNQNWSFHLTYDAICSFTTLSFFWSDWGFEYEKTDRPYKLIFADQEDKPIIERLGLIFQKLFIESGRMIQKEELNRREKIRRKADAERAKKLKPYIDEENGKVEQALKDAKAYQNANIIRDYAKAYYEKFSASFGQLPRKEEYYNWLLKRADWVDPLIENDYDSFLQPQ